MTRIALDGREYWVKTRRDVIAPLKAPRLVVAGFQPNAAAADILRVCIDSIQRFTPQPHELWIVDNASPAKYSRWLDNAPGINVIQNLTPPRPPRRWRDRLLRRPPPYAGSYANAIALEIAARVIDPQSRYMMALHMDTMFCHPQWLDYLMSKMTENVRAVGMRLDTTRVRTIHVLALLFDFTLWRPLNLTFMHDMPRYDVGDAISIALERAGYALWACANTYGDPRVLERLPTNSPYRALAVDRALDDEGNVIFMHLGRGIGKSKGAHLPGKTSAQAWLDFGQKLTLGNLSGAAKG